MSNPGLAICKNCGKPLERRATGEPQDPFVWLHRDRHVRPELCDPDRSDLYAEKR